MPEAVHVVQHAATVLDTGLIVPALHWLAGATVLTEGLNKLERAHPFEYGLSRCARLVVMAKVLAWIALCLGAAGAVARPFVGGAGGAFFLGPVLIADRVSLADLCVLGGFAILIVRSRFKELNP